jgi:hypothetical protein
MKMKRKFALKVLVCLLVFAMMVAGSMMIPRQASAYDQGPEALRPVGRVVTVAFMIPGKPFAVVCDGIFKAKFFKTPKKQGGELASSVLEFGADHLVFGIKYATSDIPQIDGKRYYEYGLDFTEIGDFQEWSIAHPWFNYGKLGAAAGASALYGFEVSWIPWATALEQGFFMVGVPALIGVVTGEGLELLPN